MKAQLILFALLVCSVNTFDITDRFIFPPNEYINQISVHNNYIYALIESSNPATVYKIDMGSMKYIDKLQMPNFMGPRNPILDKDENNLYIMALNSSTNVIVENLIKINLNTFQVTSTVYINSITWSGCDQLFKTGTKFYCIDQYQSTCTITRIDAKTFTVEDTKKQYCQTYTRGAPPALLTPDNQYAYLAYDTTPYIVSLPNMTVQQFPYSGVQPYYNNKESPSNLQLCATPDMMAFFMKGYEEQSLVRINVTSNIGSSKYYVEPGRSLTSCVVSPDSKYVFTGYSDGSIRRADALASSFGSGYTGVLYQLDSSIQGIRILDQRTALVWTTQQMLKFEYNEYMKPMSPQRLALQQNFRNVVGMTVDREEKFAYLFAFYPRTYPNIFLTFVIKYDLQQRSIVQVVNTTGVINTYGSATLFLNAKQDRLVLIAGYATVLSTDDLSVIYSNQNFNIGDSDAFQDPTTGDIVVAKQTGFITFNIDTNTTSACNVAAPMYPYMKYLIQGPNNQVLLSSEANRMILADRTSCAAKNLTFPSGLKYFGLGTYYNGVYYLLAYNKTNVPLLYGYNLAAGNFSQVAVLPYYGIMSSQLSFVTRDSYVLLQPSFLEGYIWKLNLQTYKMEELRLYAAPNAGIYNYKTNNAYILTRTEPPSIVKISV